MALLDNGVKINTIMPGYVENHSVDVRPISDLVGRWVTCVGLGNALTWPIGYIIIQVQVDGVQGYDEDQIALVIPDLSNFMAWFPVILGTPMIGHIMNVIKESERDMLVTPWVNAWVAYLLAGCQAAAMVEDDKIATKVLDPTEYDEIVTKDSEMIDAFSSKIIHARMKTALTIVRLNVMTQALQAGEGSLPHDLAIQNAYTEMCNGSKSLSGKEWYGLPPHPEEEDSHSKSGSCQSHAWGTDVAWHDGHIGWGPRHPGTKDDNKTKTGKAVWEVRLEQPRILATRAGRFCSFPPCHVSWHFFHRILWAWLYPFDKTLDKSHRWHPI